MRLMTSIISRDKVAARRDERLIKTALLWLLTKLKSIVLLLFHDNMAMIMVMMVLMMMVVAVMVMCSGEECAYQDSYAPLHSDALQ